MLWRSQQQNVYHECFICGVRQPLSKMQWQDGKLKCKVNDCFNHGPNSVIGIRDLRVAQQVSIDRHELHPDDKLVRPLDRRADQIEVMY